MPRSMAVMKPNSAGARWPDGLVACRDSRWPSVPRILSNASRPQPSFVVTLIQIRLSVMQLEGSLCSKPHRVSRVARLHLRFGRSSLASMIDKGMQSLVGATYVLLSCGAMGQLWVTWHRQPGINMSKYVQSCHSVDVHAAMMSIDKCSDYTTFKGVNQTFWEPQEWDSCAQHCHFRSSPGSQSANLL